jgi:pilus assembly protein Flp/PilA
MILIERRIKMGVLTGIRQKMQTFFAPLKDEKGQGLVEYALILVLIAIVVIAAVTTVGKKTSNAFSTVGTSLGN